MEEKEFANEQRERNGTIKEENQFANEQRETIEIFFQNSLNDTIKAIVFITFF